MLFGWRMAVGDLAHSGGDLENQPAWVLGFSLGAWFFPGCLAFSCCLPASHPQHQRLGFRVGSSEGEGRDRTEILTAWLKTFPFLFLFYYYYFKRGVHVVFLCCPREGAGVGSLRSVGAVRGLPLPEQQHGQAGCDPGAGTAGGAGSQGAVAG